MTHETAFFVCGVIVCISDPKDTRHIIDLANVADNNLY